MMINRFVYIEGGSFLMGSPPSEHNSYIDEEAHWVTLDSFYVASHLVTQLAFEELTGYNPSTFKGFKLPVETVTWYQTILYANTLSKKENLQPAYNILGRQVEYDRQANGYRLPTEAEWEYACRAGTTTSYNCGNVINPSKANYNDIKKKTTPVGSYPPNGWGLYDMHGNVCEWCYDNYGMYKGLETNPLGVDTGIYKVVRGGSWNHPAKDLQSAARGGVKPGASFLFLGFRLARTCL